MVNVERLCTWLGSAALALCLIGYVDAWLGSRLAMAAFAETQPAVEVAGTGLLPPAVQPRPPERGSPLGIMRIERLGLEVPVLYGTDRLTLNRGAGVIEGSDLPGADGHVIIAAHRDSYFRPLKDLRVGDVIELKSAAGVQRFAVERTFITDPLDVSVLNERGKAMLTLITCYPFYYVGFAPERFIVEAVPRQQ